MESSSSSSGSGDDEYGPTNGARVLVLGLDLAFSEGERTRTLRHDAYILLGTVHLSMLQGRSTNLLPGPKSKPSPLLEGNSEFLVRLRLMAFANGTRTWNLVTALPRLQGAALRFEVRHELLKVHEIEDRDIERGGGTRD